MFPPPVGNPECLNDRILAQQSAVAKQQISSQDPLNFELSTFSRASIVWSLVFPSCRLAATPQQQSLQCQLCSCSLSRFRVDHSENLLLTNPRYFYWVLFGPRPLFARTWPIWLWSPVHMALVTSKLTCNICTREQEKRMKESCSSSRTIRLQMRSSLSSSMICWLLVPWTCACESLWGLQPIASHFLIISNHLGA